MKREMLINVLQPEEIRIAIIEDGALDELYVERTSLESYVGNIYKGRIVNIEPSIQAAFVDFGVGRNGFLHVSDVEPAYYRHLEPQGDRRRGGHYRDRPEPPRRPAPVPYADEELEDARMEYPSASAEEIAGAAPPEGEFPETVEWDDPRQEALEAADDRVALADPPPTVVGEEDSLAEEKDPSDAAMAEEDEGSPRKGRRGRRGRKPRPRKITEEEAPRLDDASDEITDALATDDDQPRPMPSSERRTEEDQPAPPPLEPQHDVADEELSFSMASPPRPSYHQETKPSEAPGRSQPVADEPLSFAPAPRHEPLAEANPSPEQALEEPPASWKQEYQDEPPAPTPALEADEFAAGSPEPEETGAQDFLGDEDAIDVEIRELGGDENSRPLGRSPEEEQVERPRERGYHTEPPPFQERPYRDRPPSYREERGDRRPDRRDDRGGGRRDDRRGGRPGDRRDDRRGGPRRMMSGRPGFGRPKPLIQDIFKRGQEVLVQVIKEGIGTKGPTLSTYISIAGRYLVLMPGLQRIGVSRKIQDDESRRRLRETMNELHPPKGLGFIIRTAGIDRNKKELQSDLAYLSKIWHVVVRRIKKTKSPAEIYQESDMVTRTIRDIFTAEIDTIFVDEPAAFEKAKEFLQVVMPRYANRIQLYESHEPMFHKYGIEDEMVRIQQRHVPLPYGGSIVIDQAEACVAIDVNSGTFRADNNAEETAYQMNLQAAKEIARQLRLRDLGGVIVNDFIDMRDEKHRRAVEKALRDAVKRDRARTKILRISQFGIIEMTRQRIRPSLKRSVYQDCGHCHGTGHIKTNESMSIEVMRLVQLAAGRENILRIEVRVHQDVAHYLLNRKRGPIAQLEERGGKQIVISAVANVSPEFREFLCLDNNGSEVKFMPMEDAPQRPGRR